MPELKLTYSPGSYYRPYREHDELRIAKATLLHKSSGRTLEVGALLVRRAHRDQDSVLLTTGLGLGMEGRELADLYYARWPVQENYFKEAAVVGLKQHRGNCGRIVSNIAVVTELERLERRAERDKETLQQLTVKTEQRAFEAEQRAQEQQHAKKALTVRRQRLDELVKQGKTSDKTFARAALDHQQALSYAETCDQAADKARAELAADTARHTKLVKRHEETAARRAKLEPRRTIRQLDVAQDAIHTATKLTALQLIVFVLREYLFSLSMTPETFIRRVFPIPGRKEVLPESELIVLYENPRDPKINEALRDACGRLNKRAIRREGRVLRFAIEPAPHKSQSG